MPKPTKIRRTEKAMENPVVEVTEGKLKGKSCKSVNNLPYFAFKSIPYAKPPVGELRFLAPVPPEPWDGVRDATNKCNFCAQYDFETQSITGSEDCLYLNVYTPKLQTTESELLPVMIYIHGGGFVGGNGTDDALHGPEYLIEKDVVIVGFNYRLGILGFLSLDCKEAPGNMGLKDQVQALKWVQQNIAKFGGDPKNVTIFGISAGGASVEYHVMSPMSKGLFHKAIAQSGSSLQHWANNLDVKELAFKVPALKGKVINEDDQLLKYLKELPVKDLVSTSVLTVAANRKWGGLFFGFVPTVEKPGDWVPFLSEIPYDILSQGKFNKVPYITGFCTREGLLMLCSAVPLFEKFKEEKNFVDYLPFQLDDTEKQEYENKLKSIYLDGQKTHQDEDSYAIDYFGDIDMIAGCYVAATLIAKNNSPVYFYEFSYDGELNYLKKKTNITREGACHADDGGYLVTSEKLKDEPSATDVLVRNRMVEMWTSFAKVGDPTPKIDEVITTKWEPITETEVTRLIINKNLTMKDNVYPDRIKLYTKLYENCYKSN